MQSMLLALRREESKREYTRLRDELESLKTDFLHKVCVVELDRLLPGRKVTEAGRGDGICYAS